MTEFHETDPTFDRTCVDGEENRLNCPQPKAPVKTGPMSALSLFLGILLVLGSCTSATNFSGATAPLPTGQTGSLSPLVAALGNCYIQDTTTCSSSYTGSNGITAVAAVTYGSTPTNTVFFGDKNGSIYDADVTSAAPSTINTCISGSGSQILSLAVIPGSSSPQTVFFATSAGVFYEPYTSCSSTGSETKTTVTASSLLTYSGASTTPEIVGMTTTGSYFTCTTTSCTSPTAIANLKGQTVTAIASDPTYPVVYVATSANGSYAIDFFSVSGTTLTYIGNYTGGELSAPTGIAVLHGANPAQNYCTQTTGGCNFLYIANAGDDAITQYVLTYTGPSNAPTGVSLNQFNAAYMGCDLFHPSSLAAITTPSTGAPAVFMGEDGTSLGPCMGVASVTFGNNVTAYTAKNE